MEYEKYLIKKGKLDLLSSLEALDKNLLNEKIKEFGVNNIYELRDCILSENEFLMECSKDDYATIMYFYNLIANENSNNMSVDMLDIESLTVFVYKNGNYNSYYIPTEIKQLIKKILGNISPQEKFNLDNAINVPIIKDLKSLLEALTVKDLRNIGDILIVNKLSNKPKKELVKIIYSALTDKDKLIELIERFIDKEYDLLKKLIKNKGTIQDNSISFEVYHFLYMVGLVFLFRIENKFYISMTDDVYNVVKTIDLKPIHKIINENTKVYNLVKSMVELYGLVPYTCLSDYYSLYYGNGKQLDIPDNALFFCERADDVDRIYINHNLYFVHRVLATNENFDKLIQKILLKQNNIKRKPIKLGELLKYSDPSYYEETVAKNKFKNYLKSKGMNSEFIETIIKMISDMYRLGHDYIGVSIEMLAKLGLEVAEENVHELLSYLIEIYNNSIIWENNGWTPIEMGKPNWQKENLIK